MRVSSGGGWTGGRIGPAEGQRAIDEFMPKARGCRKVLFLFQPRCGVLRAQHSYGYAASTQLPERAAQVSTKNVAIVPARFTAK